MSKKLKPSQRIEASLKDWLHALKPFNKQSTYEYITRKRKRKA